MDYQKEAEKIFFVKPVEKRKDPNDKINKRFFNVNYSRLKPRACNYLSLEVGVTS